MAAAICALSSGSGLKKLDEFLLKQSILTRQAEVPIIFFYVSNITGIWVFVLVFIMGFNKNLRNLAIFTFSFLAKW